MRDALLEIIQERLAQHPEILFAILFGSAAVPARLGAEASFRDLDIAVFVNRQRVGEAGELPFELTLETELNDAVRFPVEVRVVNRAALPFRFNVIQGYPIYIADEDAFDQFRERTWDDWLDFAPVAMRYFEEVA